MKRQDIVLIAVSSVVAAIFAVVISGVLFGGQRKQITVPNVEKISSDFPDVQNDPAYKVIFNKNALDPTQTITIGQGPNSQPFSGTQ